MTFTLTSLIMDAADPEEESSFWHRLLGGTLTRTPTHHFVRTDGLPVLVIQHSPGHVPPRWPDGAPQQMHFDLAVDDAVTSDERVLDAGGLRLRPAHGVTGAARPGSGVYASPAGHPFCLRWA